MRQHFPAFMIAAAMVVATPAAAQGAGADGAAVKQGIAAFEAGDFLDAFVKLKPLSDGGDATASRYLARMFESGLGVPQNLTEAARLRRNVATFAALEEPSTALQADAIGALREGLLAFDRREYLDAFVKLRPLADEGDARAQLRLGDMFADGLGVPKNLPEARRLYQLASVQNSVWSPLASSRLTSIPSEDSPIGVQPRPTTYAAEASAAERAQWPPPEPKKKIPWGKIILGAVVVAGAVYVASEVAKGGGFAGAGAPADYAWRWDSFRDQFGSLTWRCRGMQSGEFADDYRCAGQAQIDLTWPGP